MKMLVKDMLVTIGLSRDEALVLSELLQRLTEEQESKFLPLLKNSAEFAVLCRLNNHLEKNLPELLEEDYEMRLDKAQHRIVKESGRYPGIAES